jgi:hypothetical protein
VAELAKLFNVSPPTVYLVLDRHQTRHDPGDTAGGTVEGPDITEGLPADTRPLPDVSKYDELLSSRNAAER